MKKNLIQKIAALSGSSPSTVKRALGNYGGVSAATKQKIWDIAIKEGYEYRKKSLDIGIILPQSPSYFWRRLSKILTEKVKDIPFSHSFYYYTDINNELDAQNCIKLALEAQCKTLIISAPNTDSIKKTLQDVSDDVFIVLLEEFLELQGVVFVGEDSYYTGSTLARYYHTRYPGGKCIGLFSSKTDANEKRKEAFIRTSKLLGQKVLDISLSEKHYTMASPALYARQIEKYADQIDCICCLSGEIKNVFKALEKLNLTHVSVIGFEQEDFSNQRPKIFSSQNLEAQSQAAVKIVNDYLVSGALPKIKEVYIENTWVL